MLIKKKLMWAVTSLSDGNWITADYIGRGKLHRKLIYL